MDLFNTQSLLIKNIMNRSTAKRYEIWVKITESEQLAQKEKELKEKEKQIQQEERQRKVEHHKESRWSIKPNNIK